MKEKIIILGIESSCDDTASAVCIDGRIVSSVVASQNVHAEYGGVVPELASRAHLLNLIPTINHCLREADIDMRDLSAIAVTLGPGLLGSLVVGVCGAKGLAAGLGIPLVAVDHMEGHIMSVFIDPPQPTLPMICLTVSGGHSQLTEVHAIDNQVVVGRTRDDAAGEAFDKIGKLLGLKYPAGPEMDKLAQKGKAIFPFTQANVPELDFSFSGLKTQVLYFLRDKMKINDQFINENINDLAASVQRTIIDMLLTKLCLAIERSGMKTVAVVGGVSANSLLRSELSHLGLTNGWTLHQPSIKYCTDNAAMIAIAGYYRFINGCRDDLGIKPFTKSVKQIHL